ncbi:MAG TPA: GNAT family N-acetyltransferase [Gaiellaceae bacterium]|nr:GNAT family N-acetyltransferase [Gaiellaceae bacterium]
MGDTSLIRPYSDQDERGWVVCRVLSFLDTAYHDDVRRTKERYEHPAIELVAEHDGEIVGLIDVECETEPGTVCEDRPGLGGMIWHLAVHPDHQRRGIATRLLRKAEDLSRGRGVQRFEAWTRDDEATRAWYEGRGFEIVYSYLNVYVELDEGLRDLFPITEDGIRPVRMFAHYVGDDREAMRARFARVHENVLYELRFDGLPLS